MCLPVKPYKIDKQWVGPGGLLCAVTTPQEGMNKCAYVRVGPKHPWHGKHYDDDQVHVSAHGGLTFSEMEPCIEHEDGQGWWFGMDFAHLGDSMIDPSLRAEDLSQAAKSVRAVYENYLWMSQDGHFWTTEEAAAEAENLATQLVAAAQFAPARLATARLATARLAPA